MSFFDKRSSGAETINNGSLWEKGVKRGRVCRQQIQSGRHLSDFCSPTLSTLFFDIKTQIFKFRIQLQNWYNYSLIMSSLWKCALKSRQWRSIAFKCGSLISVRGNFYRGWSKLTVTSLANAVGQGEGEMRWRLVVLTTLGFQFFTSAERLVIDWVVMGTTNRILIIDYTKWPEIGALQLGVGTYGLNIVFDQEERNKRSQTEDKMTVFWRFEQTRPLFWIKKCGE